VALHPGLLHQPHQRVAGLDAAAVERLAAERLDVEDPAPSGIAVDEGEDALEGGAHLAAGVLAGLGDGRQHGGAQLLDEAVVDAQQQLVEVRKGLVEVPRVEPGLLAHRPHRGAGPALGAQQLEACVEQKGATLGAPILGVEPDPAGGVAAAGGSWQRSLP
jgi:hypothetical protein